MTQTELTPEQFREVANRIRAEVGKVIVYSIGGLLRGTAVSKFEGAEVLCLHSVWRHYLRRDRSVVTCWCFCQRGSSQKQNDH